MFSVNSFERSQGVVLVLIEEMSSRCNGALGLVLGWLVSKPGVPGPDLTWRSFLDSYWTRCRTVREVQVYSCCGSEVCYLLPCAMPTRKRRGALEVFIYTAGHHLIRETLLISTKWVMMAWDMH